MTFSINDIASLARAANSIILIAEIFGYGFIIVISLIGLTNIFNTISTNMRMRRKEFAVLQSIGMTKREFNRMIALESLLYTTKSLLIGIPLGLLGSIAIYSIYGSRISSYAGSPPFIFPVFGVLISILVVLILVWIIMRFSIRKVRTQNIIETIRSEN
ncbi:MAG: ABC transporter permease [Clostridia bacterium]|nr:ABC transporter permease [Clostridia bacterium]